MENIKALLLVIFVLLARPFESFSCPNGLIRVGNGTQQWCVQYYNTSVTFCDAVRTCHQNGQEMISKPVHDAMTFMSDLPGDRWWVGLVDALNERATQRDGWVWIKDGQVTNATENLFNHGEPDNNVDNQDCAAIRYTSSKLLMDAACTSRYSVYCYSDAAVANRVASRPSQRKFKWVKITEFRQPASGCWIQEPNARTLEGCTVRCFDFEFGDCVGFYWHPVRRQCVLLPYFDASLPLDREDFSANSAEMLQWRKYILVDG